jgi:hypothetical protein
MARRSPTVGRLRASPTVLFCSGSALMEVDQLADCRSIARSGSPDGESLGAEFVQRHAGAGGDATTAAEGLPHAGSSCHRSSRRSGSRLACVLASRYHEPAPRTGRTGSGSPTRGRTRTRARARKYGGPWKPPTSINFCFMSKFHAEHLSSTLPPVKLRCRPSTVARAAACGAWERAAHAWRDAFFHRLHQRWREEERAQQGSSSSLSTSFCDAGPVSRCSVACRATRCRTQCGRQALLRNAPGASHAQAGPGQFYSAGTV